MPNTEKKIVLSGIDIQKDFMKPDSYKLNMVRKLLDKAPSLPLFKLSDMHGKVGVFPPHCLIGKFLPAKSHTVKNRIEEL